MKHNVVAPNVGESISEVSILKWHKQNGDAVKNGESRPLPDILRAVSSRYPGKVIDVRLNRRSNSLMYDVKVITQAGKLIRVRVDAASGTIVGVKGI